MISGRLGLYDGPGGIVLLGREEEPTRVEPELYDVVSLGGWGYVVPGASAGPGYDGVEIVEDYFGEDFPVIASGLTRRQVEQGRWTWGRGSESNHFSLAIVRHGNPRSDWKRLPVGDPRWWHGDDCVPRDQIYGRSIAWHDRPEPVTLQVRFGRFDT